MKNNIKQEYINSRILFLIIIYIFLFYLYLNINNISKLEMPI